MKMRFLGLVCCLLATCTIATAEEENENSRSTRIRIRALERELTEIPRETNESRRSSVLRLVQSNETTVEEINKVLRGAGLKGERLEELSAEIEKADEPSEQLPERFQM